MAPSAVETTTVIREKPVLASLLLPKTNADRGDYKELSPKQYDKKFEETGADEVPPATYPNYLPVWDEQEKYEPLELFEHYEHGRDADLSFKDLLPAGTQVTDLTPTIGTEVTGVQLSKLTAAGKDQLARFVAQRRVVAFRDQDFADLPIADALEYGGYFGRHHIHPTSGAPAGYPEVHLVHRSAAAAGESKTKNTLDTFLEARTSSVAWHSDVSYERQPPGTTFLYLLDSPAVGGDTLFADAVEAYKRLSPALQQRLHGLKATHSGIEQAQYSLARRGIVRREPVVHEHPLIRTHPATGEKALYVNPQFTRSIVGFKKEESDALLKFLYDHLAYGADFQARVKWQPRTVVVWDNRVTQHSALVDWLSGERRHLARITPQAEEPYETPFEA